MLLYCFKNNNYEQLKLLLKNNIDLDVIDNENNTLFHYISKYNNKEIFNLFNLNDNILNNQNNLGETCLHIAINNDNNDIITELLKTNINLDITDYQYEFTAINYLIFNNKLKYLDDINFEKININIQDYKGRTYLHYLIIYNKTFYINKLLENKNLDFNFNLSDLNGFTPLHLALQMNNLKDNYDIIYHLLIKTNLNLQDNFGNTCLFYLISNNLWQDYKKILINKKLNIYIFNNKNIQIIDIIEKNILEEFLDIVIKSFYNYIVSKKQIFVEYLEFCKTSNSFEKFKQKYPNFYNKLTENNKKLNKNDICYEIIKYFILYNKISYPEKKNKVCIKLLKPIKLGFVPYTGSNIDILCGLYYLEKNYSNVKTSLSKNFIENEKLKKFYEKTGIIYDNSEGNDFYNIEIIWNKQKLILPNNIKILLNNLKKRFFIIPIGIEIDIGFHSNMLIYDSKLKQLERFEPNGSTSPNGYHYNGSTLDQIIIYKFKKILGEFKYLSPKSYLPKIGFQTYENLEQQKKK